MTFAIFTPRVRQVIRRTAALNRFNALSLTLRRFGRRPVNVKPGNVRRHGRSTALFSALTFSFSFRSKYLLTLASTRSPAFWLRT
jgi:hypothetical protein